MDVCTKSAFFCGPSDEEKLFDPGASKRKGQECLRELRTEKFVFMLCFSVATPAEPRAEKKLFFVQILGGEKLLEKYR